MSLKQSVEPVRIADIPDEQWQLLCLMLGPFTDIPEGYVFASKEEWRTVQNYFRENYYLYYDLAGQPPLRIGNGLTAAFFRRLREESGVVVHET